MLGFVMNDIEYNFVDIVFVERILQWKVRVQELIHVDLMWDFCWSTYERFPKSSS